STASATTDIYTLSLHDALPIFRPSGSSIQAVAQDHANERLTSLAGGATPSRGHKEAQHTAIDGKPFMRAFLPRTTRGYAPTTMGVKLASPGTRKLSAVRSGRTITPLASMLPMLFRPVNRFGSSRTAV